MLTGMRFLHTVSEWLLLRSRTRYWRLVFASFGAGSAVLGRIAVSGPELVHIGAHTHLNEGVILNARAPITVGDHVHLSAGAIINTAELVFDGQPRERRPHTARPVVIGDGVWVCAGAFINGGVTIGEDAIVAAGAVVLQDVPARTVVGGVPARILKTFGVAGAPTPASDA